MKDVERYGIKIAELRRAKGYSQLDLAVKTGYESWQSISNIERGRVEAPHSKLQKIADVLGVSLAEIMEISNDTPHTSNLKPARKTSKLSKELSEQLLAQIEEMRQLVLQHS